MFLGYADTSFLFSAVSWVNKTQEFWFGVQNTFYLTEYLIDRHVQDIIEYIHIYILNWFSEMFKWLIDVHFSKTTILEWSGTNIPFKCFFFLILGTDSDDLCNIHVCKCIDCVW